MDTSPINKPRVIPPLNVPRTIPPLRSQSHFAPPEEYDGNSAADYAALGVAAAASVVGWGINAALNAGEFSDSSPSSVVANATWHPELMMLVVTLHSGHTYEYPCSPAGWAEYVAAPSKGQYMNSEYWS
jgi:hypothetical protein